jgi:hypothetical protein
MEDITNALNNFTLSVENKTNIVSVQNYLSLLIAQINIFYHKNNFFNNLSCNSTNNNITLQQLEEVSEKIRNIYPKYIELRKEQFKTNYINKLECNKNPEGLLQNIDRSNKIQSIISDLSDLLYFPANNMINDSSSIQTTPTTPTTPSQTNSELSNKLQKLNKSTIFLIMVIVLIIIIVILIIAYYLTKKFRVKKSDAITNATDAASDSEA